MHLAYVEAHSGGKKQKVMEYFDKAFDHYKNYQFIYEWLEKGEKYTYSAPLVSSLQVGKGGLAPLASNFWEREFRCFAQNILDEIRQNPKYAECFA